ncbi:hypothetical protein K505DRAFT_400844 [Melanomma pulvis-pyrius CBS 109.77]|uniref:Uncharacterized protein n=1 Tax=Melanomma pulvis-pyrius CBS 109.77 TaxID=1314802 RepID=A0A6A6XVG8_9PLEO|nr:hypothetical protein K505DRAFT_400844 [Melanomma pulvis-pyrius CBS 109.77]
MSSILGVDTQPGVYLGVWVNWSRGRILGSTLTVTEKNGALLVAFVALFITFVGSSLWRIGCFAFHHGYSAAGPQDGIYHHRQAVLKNSDNATAGLISWYELLKAWRKVGHRPYRRLLPVTLFTVLLAVSFTAASLLSSRIASAMGQEVLIRGNCGVNILGHYIAGQDKNPAVETNPEFFTVLLPFLSQRLISFSNYALSCYSNNNNTRGCNTFSKPRLPFSSNSNASCPFSGEMCRRSDGNLLLDTGYLNSHFDFGMNARPEERFLYRRTTHCAPLVTDGYKNLVNISESGVETPYVEYSYDRHLPLSESKGNVTYTYANVINGSVAHNRAFTPIEGVYRNDADVTLLFLSSNQVVSPIEINDPWYSAHQQSSGFRLSFTGWGNLTLGGYFGDETASVLGCAKQYQICYPDKSGNPSRCSRLGGKQELYWLLTSLEQSDAQLNRTKWSIMSALTGNELDAFVQTLGAGSLSSKYSLVSGIQGPIPDNQWQLDVEHWHAATLVAIQGSAVDAASGPSNPEMRKFWPPPANDQERSICNNQKIISNAHSNFSVFGLSFTFGMGGLIVIISFMLQSPTGFLRKRYSRHAYSSLEWNTNGTLQLQRLAHEELGLGTWSACTQDVPTTYKGEKLAFLDITDSDHPVLRAASLEFVDDLKTKDDGKEQPRIKHVEDTQGVRQVKVIIPAQHYLVTPYANVNPGQLSKY